MWIKTDIELVGRVTAAGIGKAYAFYTVGEKIAKSHDFTCKQLLFIHFQWLESYPNPSYQPDDEAPLFYWTIPELSLAVVGACLPILRPIIHGITPRSVVAHIQNLVTLRSLRSSNKSSKTLVSTQVPGWAGSSSEGSDMGISKANTRQSSKEGPGTMVETRDLERGYDMGGR